MRIAHLAAERAVAGRHADREDVGELGEVRLAEDHRAGVAQELGDGGVALGVRVGERQRPCRRVLRVAGRDVVLDEDGDAFERPALGILARVELLGNRERVGIELANRVQSRAGPVIGLDPRRVRAHQVDALGPPDGERLLQVGDACFLDAHVVLHRCGRRGRCQERHDSQHHGKSHHQSLPTD